MATARADDPTAIAATRRPGRPRVATVDRDVMQATIELAGEVGITRMSMDDVAERAGVSKATIYRRWSSKEALVIDSLRSAMSPFTDVDTGVVRDDIRVHLEQIAERVRRGRLADVLPHLIEVGCHDPALRASLDEYVEYRRDPLRRMIRRGIERGEIAHDIDVEVLIDALVAPFFYRQLLSNKALGRKFVAKLLAIVMPDTDRAAPLG